MANLKTAAAEIQNAKKVDKSSTWENSTYKQRIDETLKEMLPGLEGVRLDAATRFFKPEWELRSQKFLKRFMMWSKKGESEIDFSVYAKFGNLQSLNVAAIANNLGITFQAALFQVMQLSALGLCRRVEPTVNTRADPVFNVVFMPRDYMVFFLGAMDATADELSDADIHTMATVVFAPEIKPGKTSAVGNALHTLTRAMDALHAFEEVAKDPARSVGEMCQKVKQVYEATPGKVWSAAAVAATLGLTPDMVAFCLIALVLHDEQSDIDNDDERMVRVPAPQFSFSFGPPAAQTSAVDIDIGSLSTPHAKEVLRAAAAQSPTSTDPVIPPNSVRLDAAFLGAATVVQLQATEQSLRAAIETASAVAQDARTRANNVGNAVDKLNDNGDIRAEVDALRAQVSVLMRLVDFLVAAPTRKLDLSNRLSTAPAPRPKKAAPKPVPKKAAKKPVPKPKKKAAKKTSSVSVKAKKTQTKKAAKRR